MDRRNFLKSSTAIAGGLVLGITASGEVVAADEKAPDVTPWLRIGTDNSVTFYCARSEMGQDVFTSMTMLVAEELDYPLEKIRIEFAPAKGVYVNDLLTVQITGGSTSVRDAWKKLRLVGATAREQLKGAAAAKWGVTASQIQTQNGVLSSGQRQANYGEMAHAATQIKLASVPALRPAGQFKYIGKDIKRMDTAAKVNSKAVYGVDVRQKNMLVASLAQCPVIGGKVVSVNESAARGVKGVVDVIRIPDGVAVLAADYYTAKKGRDALKITWDRGQTSPIASMAAIENGIREASKKTGAVIHKTGNHEKPLAGASKTITAEYFSPYQAHATLEPVNCSAQVLDGECHVWGPIQYQFGAQATAMEMTGMPAEKVHIHTTFLGGGYGRKLELDFVAQVVAIAKRTKGKPVRLQWSREDDMTHDFYRPASLNQMSAGIDDKGNVTGISMKMTSQSVTARAFPPFVVDGNDPFMSEGSANITYGVPNIRIENVIHDSGVRVGYWRAVSNNLNTFAIESFVDEIASQTKQDPLKLRMNLLAQNPRAQKVLQAAADKAGWGNGGRHLGLAQTECYGTYVAMVADISMKGNTPVVNKLTVAVDPGVAIRPDQVKAQIESAVLLGYSAAMKTAITFKDGEVEQSNFHNYPLLRMSEAPQVDVLVMPSGDDPGGMGEVGVPCVAPAIANAIAAATGTRNRKMPFTSA